MAHIDKLRVLLTPDALFEVRGTGVKWQVAGYNAYIYDVKQKRVVNTNKHWVNVEDLLQKDQSAGGFWEVMLIWHRNSDGKYALIYDDVLPHNPRIGMLLEHSQ